MKKILVGSLGLITLLRPGLVISFIIVILFVTLFWILLYYCIGKNIKIIKEFIDEVFFYKEA